MPDGPRYDDDFYAWTQYQAKVLRSLRTRDNRFDREPVLEKIEDLGKERARCVAKSIPSSKFFLELRDSPRRRCGLGRCPSDYSRDRCLYRRAGREGVDIFRLSPVSRRSRSGSIHRGPHGPVFRPIERDEHHAGRRGCRLGRSGGGWRSPAAWRSRRGSGRRAGRRARGPRPAAAGRRRVGTPGRRRHGRAG